jgi:hypothetical protein
MNEKHFTALDRTGQVALALAIAEACLTVLDADHDVAALGREALNVAWQVAEGDAIGPEAVARYVDGNPAEKDFGVLEAKYGASPKGSAVIAITLALGYAARSAYDRAGRRDWSAIIAEIDEHSLDDIWKFAHESGALNESRVRAQANYIRAHSNTLNRRELLLLADVGPS